MNRASKEASLGSFEMNAVFLEGWSPIGWERRLATILRTQPSPDPAAFPQHPDVAWPDVVTNM